MVTTIVLRLTAGGSENFQMRVLLKLEALDSIEGSVGEWRLRRILYVALKERATIPALPHENGQVVIGHVESSASGGPVLGRSRPSCSRKRSPAPCTSSQDSPAPCAPTLPPSAPKSPTCCLMASPRGYEGDGRLPAAPSRAPLNTR